MDEALRKLAETSGSVGLGLGTAALGGPEVPGFLKGLGSAALQMLMPHRQGVDYGVVYPLYHGTNSSFLEHDPARSGDIGMHFGTLEQADRVAMGYGGQLYEYATGANIRPSNVDIDRPIRLPDIFSRYSSMRDTLRELLGSPTTLRQQGYGTGPGIGMTVSPEEQKVLEDAAYLADVGPTWGSAVGLGSHHGRIKNFWNAVESVLKKQGYDGIVYSNELEGFGDSYAVFDPKKVTPRFGPVGGLGGSK
jgi:hypothetical protein